MCGACERLQEQAAAARKAVVSPLRTETPSDPLAAVFDALPPLGHKLPAYQRPNREKATPPKAVPFSSTAALDLDLGLTLDLRGQDSLPSVDARVNLLEASDSARPGA